MKTNFAKGLYILAILGAATIVCGSDVKKSSGQNKDQDMFEKSRQVQKQLLRSDISPIAESTASETKKELSRLIDQLQALELPGADEETETSEQPTAKIITQQVQKSPEQNTTLQKSQDENKTRAKIQNDNKSEIDIKSLLKNADNIVNPLAAADCLYVHGEHKAAGDLYQLGLKQLIDTKESFFRPWALFQTGNCLRRSDPDSAYKFYEQLISEYPESYWTPAARSEQQIIDWFKTNKSSITLEKYISDPNSL